MEYLNSKSWTFLLALKYVFPELHRIESNKICKVIDRLSNNVSDGKTVGFLAPKVEGV